MQQLSKRLMNWASILEPNVREQAERTGDDENIREDDGGVEVEAADRLQRDFGGEFRGEAKIEEAAGLGAYLAVLRQIATGLPHHPDRRYRLPAAGKHFKKRFNSMIPGQTLGPLR